MVLRLPRESSTAIASVTCWTTVNGPFAVDGASPNSSSSEPVSVLVKPAIGPVGVSIVKGASVMATGR
ncbi:MAG TPA: hypothetical protein VHV74_20045 [Pseudonocardiaceae bacterium]|nr:hypothetical protein [Pseudonocardiaceae bacterium]